MDGLDAVPVLLFDQGEQERVSLLDDGESVGCRNFPSTILSFACQVKCLESVSLRYMRLNLGIIGKYHKTFAGDNFFLYRGAPHLGHSFNDAYSFRNKTQSFGQACILS